MATAASTNSPPEISITPFNRALLTVAIMGASVIQILDATIANVALPHMQTSLGATLDSVTWVLTSYIVASAIAMPITGWLADRIGGRELFLIAVIGFVISSMLCGLATNLEEMILFRVIQGISGAFIAPLSQTAMLDINPPERHAKAMAIWGMGIMVGPILGPVIGGWLTESYSWRWCFYVNVPLGAVTITVLWALLPRKPVTRRKFDHLGFWALAIGLASLQMMLDRGAQLDWFDSWEIRIEALLALAGFWIFIVQMATARNGLFSRVMLTNRNYATSLIFMLVIGVVMFANMALLPPMMQNLFGYPVIDTGLLLAPRGVGVLISMAVAGQLLGKVDARHLVGAGFLIVIFSLWQMSHWSLQMDWRPFVISGLIQGLGMGLVFIPLNTLAFSSLPPELRTDGSSLLNLGRSLGASIGISVVSTFLGSNIQTSHQDLGSHITSSTINSIDASTIDRFPGIADPAMAMVNMLINQQAAMIAYINNFWLIMWLTIAAFPLLLLLRPAKLEENAPPLLD
ncbi:DHA2 family efflux MFS transporter permease subunit [Parasphingorhabdus sp.]|uniref:DHA2 family efflux MFS transporter permease subunit n=1 Tax=Parasphingorhabdus sp. TaxID=2709688 RepID=UPI003A8DB013